MSSLLELAAGVAGVASVLTLAASWLQDLAAAAVAAQAGLLAGAAVQLVLVTLPPLADVEVAPPLVAEAVLDAQQACPLVLAPVQDGFWAEA